MDETVFIMDDKKSKDNDHAEVKGQGIYYHYLDDQEEAMMENIGCRMTVCEYIPAKKPVVTNVFALFRNHLGHTAT